MFIENLPLQAWSEEGFRQLLGDVCLFDRMEERSFTQEETRFLEVWAWMWNPDTLPRSKLASFFPKGAGQIPRRPGQAQSPAVAPPPAGDLREVLIHLSCYENWKPPASPSPDSGASGLPSSVSSSPSPFPDY